MKMNQYLRLHPTEWRENETEGTKKKNMLRLFMEKQIERFCRVLYNTEKGTHLKLVARTFWENIWFMYFLHSRNFKKQFGTSDNQQLSVKHIALKQFK